MCKLRNEGLNRKTNTESVKKMLEESKKMNNEDKKETRKRKSKQVKKKVMKKSGRGKKWEKTSVK